MHRVLRQALQQAAEWQMLARNPADLVKPPKVERKQMKTLDADGTVELIEAARGTSLFVPIILGVLCGLRRGEVAALRWRSVDLERGQMAVSASTEQKDDGIREKETKSGKSRAVALPAMIIEEFRQHRLRQAEQFSRWACGSTMIITSWPVKMGSRYSRARSARHFGSSSQAMD